MATAALEEERLAPSQAVVIEGVAFSSASMFEKEDPRRIASQRIASEVTATVEKVVPEMQEHITADATISRSPGRTLTESAAMAAILAEREVNDNPNVALLGAAEKGHLIRQAKDLAENAARGLAGEQEERHRQKEEAEKNTQNEAIRQPIGAGQALSQEELLGAVSQPRLNEQRVQAEGLAALQNPQTQRYSEYLLENPELARIHEAVKLAAQSSREPLAEREAILVNRQEVPRHELTLDEALARHTRETDAGPADTAGRNRDDAAEAQIHRIERLYAQARQLTMGNQAGADPGIDIGIEKLQHQVAA